MNKMNYKNSSNDLSVKKKYKKILFFKKLFFSFLFLTFLFSFFSYIVFSISIQKVEFSSSVIKDKIFIPKNSVLKVTFDSNILESKTYFTINGETVSFDSCNDNICTSSLNFYKGGNYEFKFFYNGNYLLSKKVVVDLGKIVVNKYNFYSSNDGSNNVFLKVFFKDFADYSNSIFGCGLNNIKILDSDKNVLLEESFSNVQDSFTINVDSIKDKIENSVLLLYDCFGNENSFLLSSVDFNPPKIVSVNGFDSNSISVGVKNDGFDKTLLFSVKILEDNNIDLDNSFLTLKSSSSSFSSTVKFSSCNSFFDNNKKFFLCQASFSIPYNDGFDLKIVVSDGSSIVSKDFNVNIVVDNSPPKFLGFYTNSRGYNDELFLKDFFYADFKEDNFISEDSVSVKLNNFNSLELSPSYCFKKSSDIVKCVFDVREIKKNFDNNIFDNGLEVSLISAKDFYGNSFVVDDNNLLSSIFFFDFKKPKVKAFLLGFDDNFYYDNIVFDSPKKFKVKIVVYKEGSMIDKLFYLKPVSEFEYESVPLKKLSCENTDNFYICTFEGFTISSSSLLKFSLFDSSNNSVVLEKSVVFSEDNVDINSELWILDKNNIVVSPKFFFQKYSSEFSVSIPVLKSSFNNNVELSSSIVECNSDNANIDFVNSYVSDNNIVVFGFLSSDSTSKIDIDCNVKLKSYIPSSNSFTSFEEHSFSFSLYPFDINSFDDNVYSQYFNSDGTFKTSFLTSSNTIEFLSSAKNLVSISEDICDVLTAVKTGSITSDTIAILVKYGVVTSIAYPSVKSVADKIFNLNEKTEKYGEKFCSFVACKNSWSEKVESFYNKIELPVKNKLSNFGFSFEDKKIEDSLVLSSLSLCLPGVVKNLKRIQNIECASQLCILNSFEGKVPFSYCKISSSIAYCQYTGNEVLQIIPYGSIVESFNIIGDILEHPFTYLTGFIIDVVSKYIEEVRVVIEAKKLIDIFNSFGSEESSNNIFDDDSYCNILNEKVKEYNENILNS